RAGAPLASRRRELDPAPDELAKLPVARPETQPDALPRDLEVLDTAVRLEQGAQLLVIDAEDEEIRVLRVEPEQLVADGAADEVRVEPERADVVLDLLLHVLIVPATGNRTAFDQRRQRVAIASISTRAPEGRAATPTVERAGRSSPTCPA